MKIKFEVDIDVDINDDTNIAYVQLEALRAAVKSLRDVLGDIKESI